MLNSFRTINNENYCKLSVSRALKRKIFRKNFFANTYKNVFEDKLIVFH